MPVFQKTRAVLASRSREISQPIPPPRSHSINFSRRARAHRSLHIPDASARGTYKSRRGLCTGGKNVHFQRASTAARRARGTQRKKTAGTRRRRAKKKPAAAAAAAHTSRSAGKTREYTGRLHAH